MNLRAGSETPFYTYSRCWQNHLLDISKPDLQLAQVSSGFSCLAKMSFFQPSQYGWQPDAKAACPTFQIPNHKRILLLGAQCRTVTQCSDCSSTGAEVADQRTLVLPLSFWESYRGPGKQSLKLYLSNSELGFFLETHLLAPTSWPLRLPRFGRITWRPSLVRAQRLTHSTLSDPQQATAQQGGSHTLFCS